MDQGLTTAQAADILKKTGYNELSQSRIGFLSQIKELISEPMIILLIIGSILYFTLGEISDAVPLLISVVAIILIDIYEERKAKKALEALQQIGSPRAFVLRNGETVHIASREVVVGDYLILNEGDRVAADATLTQVTNLSCEESMLTGESVAVPKLNGAAVFMGTLITTGHGIAQVTATGPKTEIGKIGKSLNEIKIEASPSKKEIGSLVKKIAFIGATLCLSLVVYYGLRQGNWLQGILAGITLAMSVIPEEIPVVLAVFTILGAFRISKKRVLARRSSVIETLGATTVICLDKTGTITQNKMRLSGLYIPGKSYEIVGDNIPNEFAELIKVSVLASGTRTVDPIEKAIHEFGKIPEGWHHQTEVPLNMAVSEIWKDDSGNDLTALKGAPETILDYCLVNLIEREVILIKVVAMAEAGLRTLAVAVSSSEGPRFLGLLGFTDPIRPAIKDAVKMCYSAGIRIVIITGDHPETAKRIALEIGLKNSRNCILGPNLKSLNESQLEKEVKTNNIFARVSPGQKLLLVEALKKSGEVVTMIGDGVNDAPAIKAANIGVAMGEHGTDVARESASLVLLDDNFTSVVDAVRLGRRIYANIRRAIVYVIALHFPIAGMALIPVFLGFPPVFFPIHIAIMELFTDPVSSMVFESQDEEPNIMKKSPRKLSEKMVTSQILISGVIQGLICLGFALLTFGIATSLKLGESEVRTMVIVTLLVINIGVVLANRVWSIDRSLSIFIVASTIFVIISPHVPLVRDFLKLGQISLLHQATAIGIGLLATATLVFIKKIRTIHFVK
ncbi:MAG: cation-translocating P-type ATPase [candidate division WWE3 bacterium]|nr:cation-translocating P-type ATPase [candidate division WWE3 bacterium]